MPFRANIGKELTRSTICVRRSRATVTLMCSDRVAVGTPSELFVGVHWSNFEGEVTLTFRKVTSGVGGEIRFDAVDGPASRTFSSTGRQLVRIVGVTPTAGVGPDVMLDVLIEGEAVEHLPLSVGPVATTVAVRAADGVSPAPELVFPASLLKLKAVPTPAGPATFQWLTAQPALVSIVGPAGAADVEVRPGATASPGLTAPDGSVAVCVLVKPAAGPAVMAVHHIWTLFDPEQPGPYPVGRTTYTAPDFTIAAGREGWPAPIVVSVEALVRYPAQVAGDNTPVSSRRASYPLVILAHGRHDAAEFERDGAGAWKLDAACRRKAILIGGLHPEFKNHEGLAYLADHLASNGFIAVSINLNGKFNPATGSGQLVRPEGRGLTCHTADQVAVAHRGLTILRHIMTMKGKNAGPDPLFTGKVDLDRIALIGHSRGGEAVAAAHVINKALPPPAQAKIKAVTSIAPTDSRGHTVDVPFLTIIGSDDGDVADANGHRLYDRAAAPKHLVWVVGGIHNFFSSNWQWQDEVPAVPAVSRPQHEAIAKGYGNVFLQAHLHGAPGATAYFSGERPLRAVAAVELHHCLRVPGGKLVDDFETLPKDASRNALAKAVVGTDLVSFDEQALNTRDRACVASRPAWVHDTDGLVIEWAALTARYSSEVGSMDVSPDGTVLSFRVGQDRTGNPPGPQDFHVTLTDGLGRSATLRVGAAATIPRPRTKHLLDFSSMVPPACSPGTPSVTICSLKTVRLPVARFKAANSALDTTAIASIRFEFDINATGRRGIDDLEFSL
jgi:hypothetical protein